MNTTNQYEIQNKYTEDHTVLNELFNNINIHNIRN